MITKELIQEVVKEVSKISGVSEADICSRKKSREYSVPRQISCLLARKYFNPNLKDIAGIIYGNEDHSTVIHGCKRAEDLIQTDYRASVIYSRADLSLSKRFAFAATLRDECM